MRYIHDTHSFKDDQSAAMCTQQRSFAQAVRMQQALWSCTRLSRYQHASTPKYLLSLSLQLISKLRFVEHDATLPTAIEEVSRLGL